MFLGVTGAVRDVLANVEIVEVSESLADVTETTFCMSGKVELLFLLQGCSHLHLYQQWAEHVVQRSASSCPRLVQVQVLNLYYSQDLTVKLSTAAFGRSSDVLQVSC